jgi:hypothetical protein
MNNAFAIAVLAKREAIKAVKADMQARGIRLSYVSPRDISDRGSRVSDCAPGVADASRAHHRDRPKVCFCKTQQ